MMGLKTVLGCFKINKNLFKGADETLILMSKIIAKENFKMDIMVGGGVKVENIEKIKNYGLDLKWYHGSFSKKERFENDVFDLGTSFETQV